MLNYEIKFSPEGNATQTKLCLDALKSKGNVAIFKWITKEVETQKTGSWLMSCIIKVNHYCFSNKITNPMFGQHTNPALNKIRKTNLLKSQDK